MRLHHLGYVGRSLPALQRRFAAEGGEVLGDPVADPVQRVVVQFYRQPESGETWELVTPLQTVEDSPLQSRLSRGGGLDHVCYELAPEDGALEAVLDREQARGAQVVCAPVSATAFGRRVAFVFRRSGRLIEFVEARQPGMTI